MENIRIEQHGFMGMVWVAAWLFTVGYLHLTYWQIVFAIVLWPYYFGATLSSIGL